MLPVPNIVSFYPLPLAVSGFLLLASCFLFPASLTKGASIEQIHPIRR
jgi:hypothetical protein